MWLPEKNCALKINLAIGFIRKNRLECIGKAIMMLEIMWLPENNCALKINLAIGFIRKKPAGMHW